MDIASHELKAFIEIARTQNITTAARNLFVTQSALSQRLQKLESTLECTLFIRDRELKLTEAGHKLLRYAHSVKALEEEFLNEVQSSTQEITGTLRVAAFSSVLRSVLIPSLSPFLRKHPKVHCEFQSFEMLELPKVLERGEADFVVCDYRMQKSHISEVLLGFEEYVVIESTQHSAPHDVYLDHGPQDNATESYFATQKNAPKAYRRSFMGDVYGILDGVEAGLGRAVMSKHLLKNRKNLKIVSGYKAYKREVVLHTLKRAYVPKLHQMIIEQLSNKPPMG